MFKFYGASVSAGSGNGVVAGLFIPIADIPMISAGEFASGVSQATKESKLLLGLGTALYDYYTANSANILGFAVSLAQASVSAKIVNWTYSFTTQKVAKQADGTFDILPLPSIGTNSGVGGVNIDDIFANAALVSAEGAISGEGVLIPNSDIVGATDAVLGSDMRDYLEGLLTFIAGSGVSVRGTSTASGITALSNPTNYSIFALPAAAYDATNPTTDILASELGYIATVQKSVAYTVQLTLNSITGNFDVNSVVS
jgi:hypothetical protein